MAPFAVQSSRGERPHGSWELKRSPRPCWRLRKFPALGKAQCSVYHPVCKSVSGDLQLLLNPLPHSDFNPQTLTEGRPLLPQAWVIEPFQWLQNGCLQSCQPELRVRVEAGQDRSERDSSDNQKMLLFQIHLRRLRFLKWGQRLSGHSVHCQTHPHCQGL